MKSCNLHRVLHRGMADNMKQIRKYCNLCREFHRGMVEDMKQIKKSCNVYVYFVVAQSTMVSFPLFSVIVCVVNDMKLTWATC